MANQTGEQANTLLRKAAENPPENYVVIIGGTRIAEKIRYIAGFIDKAKKILVGGAVAYTFMAARGDDIGNSKIERACVTQCRDILRKAAEKNVKMIFPIDHVAAVDIEPDVTIKMIKQEEYIPDNMMGLDIGFDSIELFSREIREADLILWYGPLGVFEIDTFSAGTSEIAEVVARSHATSIIIGGALSAAFEKKGLARQVSFMTAESVAVLDRLMAV